MSFILHISLPILPAFLLLELEGVLEAEEELEEPLFSVLLRFLISFRGLTIGLTPPAPWANFLWA